MIRKSNLACSTVSFQAEKLGPPRCTFRIALLPHECSLCIRQVDKI